MDKRLQEILDKSKKTVVLTGAGVSTFSGIPDFRSSTGLYSKEFGNLRVEEILSIDFFKKDPKTFYMWAKDYWYNLENYEPTFVHKKLAELEKDGKISSLFTQNIDMLHQKAGSKKVYELHGSARLNHCIKCNKEYTYSEVCSKAKLGEVPICSCGGAIKPDIILYGENLNEEVLSLAFSEFAKADVCLVLGSSLVVQPAASLPLRTIGSGGRLVIINKTETPLDNFAVLKLDDLKLFN